MRNKAEEEINEACRVTPASPIEQLKIKRTKVAREMTAKLRQYDRVIRLAEETEADKVMREVYDMLED
jgi:hypothetical protein